MARMRENDEIASATLEMQECMDEIQQTRLISLVHAHLS